MAIIGATAAKVQPCISGSRTPKRQKPIDWINVAMPATSRSALIRYGEVAGLQLSGLDQGAADDQRHRHRAGVHGQHVLQAQRGQSGQGWDLVDRVDGRFGREIGARRGVGHGQAFPPRFDEAMTWR